MRERWTKGYGAGGLDAAQKRIGLCFPPDLLALLLDRRLVEGDWRFDDNGIRAAPRLFPLIDHRYLPETPHQAGNPVSR